MENTHIFITTNQLRRDSKYTNAIFKRINTTWEKNPSGLYDLYVFGDNNESETHYALFKNDAIAKINDLIDLEEESGRLRPDTNKSLGLKAFELISKLKNNISDSKQS